MKETPNTQEKKPWWKRLAGWIWGRAQNAVEDRVEEQIEEHLPFGKDR